MFKTQGTYQISQSGSKCLRTCDFFPFSVSFSLFGSRQTAFNGDQVEVETLEFLFGCSDIELAVLATW